MATGAFGVRSNITNTDTLPNAGSSLLLLWPTAVASGDAGVGYDGVGGFALPELGKYLVMVSDHYWTADTTNNERINVKTTLNLGGTTLKEGFTSGYIRKDYGAQGCVVFGAAVIDVTSLSGTDNTLKVYSERVDDSTTGTVARVTDRSGISIIKLDDTLNHARYESSAKFSVSATDNTYNTANIGTTLEQASPFTRTGNVVDIATNNLVLAVHSYYNDNSVSGRTEMQSCLELGGTVVDGSWTQTYGPRAADGCSLGGTSNVCLLRPTSGDDLELQLVSREDSNEDWHATLQLVELPAAAEAIVLEATTGDMNAGNLGFDYDTNPYIDTGSFDWGVGVPDEVEVLADDDYLVMVSLAVTSTAGSAGARAIPAGRIRVSGVDLEHMAHSTYNRASGTADHATLAYAGLAPGLVNTDKIETRLNRMGSDTTTITPNSAAMSVLRLSTMSTPSISGDLDATESGDDTTTATGGVEVQGQVTPTEAPDALLLHAGWPAATGIEGIGVEALGVNTLGGGAAEATPAIIAGSLDVTEPVDSATIGGDVDIVGTAAATEPVDTAAITATLIVAGDIALTDDAVDTAAIVADAAVTAALAASDVNDSASADISVEVAAALSITDVPDTTSVEGDVVVAGSMPLVEPVDTTAISASNVVAADLAITEEAEDTAAATARLVNGAALDVTDVNDAATATGIVGIAATLAVTDPEDTAFFNGSSTLYEIEGDLAVTEAADTALLNGTVDVEGDLAATDLGDSTAVDAGLITSGDLSIAEESQDTAGMAVQVVASGSAALTESATPDVMAATGAQPIGAVLAATESGQDTTAQSGTVNIQGTMPIVESEQDTATADADLAVSSDISITESSDSSSVVALTLVQGGAGIVESSIEDSAAAVAKVYILGDLILSEDQDTFQAGTTLGGVTVAAGALFLGL